MIIHNNSDNCCILDFKCTKTRFQNCEHYIRDNKKSRCISEYNNFCFNVYAQRELLLEVFYPDSSEIKDLVIKNKAKRKKEKEISIIEVKDNANKQ